MGDPVEVGLALDRAHKPWLGRLWQASWAVLAAAVLLAAMWLMDGSPWLRRVWNTVLPPEDLAGFEEQMLAYDVLLNQQEGHDYIFYEGPLTGEEVQMDGYAISVRKGRWYRWESGPGYYRAISCSGSPRTASGTTAGSRSVKSANDGQHGAGAPESEQLCQRRHVRRLVHRVLRQQLPPITRNGRETFI